MIRQLVVLCVLYLASSGSALWVCQTGLHRWVQNEGGKGALAIGFGGWDYVKFETSDVCRKPKHLSVHPHCAENLLNYVKSKWDSSTIQYHLVEGTLRHMCQKQRPSWRTNSTSAICWSLVRDVELVLRNGDGPEQHGCPIIARTCPPENHQCQALTSGAESVDEQIQGMGWTCPPARYHDGVCDCLCGLWDPDCGGLDLNTPFITTAARGCMPVRPFCNALYMGMVCTAEATGPEDSSGTAVSAEAKAAVEALNNGTKVRVFMDSNTRKQALTGINAQVKAKVDELSQSFKLIQPTLATCSFTVLTQRRPDPAAFQLHNAEFAVVPRPDSDYDMSFEDAVTGEQIAIPDKMSVQFNKEGASAVASSQASSGSGGSSASIGGVTSVRVKNQVFSTSSTKATALWEVYAHQETFAPLKQVLKIVGPAKSAIGDTLYYIRNTLRFQGTEGWNALHPMDDRAAWMEKQLNPEKYPLAVGTQIYSFAGGPEAKYHHGDFGVFTVLSRPAGRTVIGEGMGSIKRGDARGWLPLDTFVGYTVIYDDVSALNQPFKVVDLNMTITRHRARAHLLLRDRPEPEDPSNPTPADRAAARSLSPASGPIASCRGVPEGYLPQFNLTRQCFLGLAVSLPKQGFDSDHVAHFNDLVALWDLSVQVIAQRASQLVEQLETSFGPL